MAVEETETEKNLLHIRRMKSVVCIVEIKSIFIFHVSSVSNVNEIS